MQDTTLPKTNKLCKYLVTSGYKPSTTWKSDSYNMFSNGGDKENYLLSVGKKVLLQSQSIG